jgi:hypothetical protein
MASINRRSQVAASPILNGIDFVQIVNSAQTILVVHFLNGVAVAGTLKAAPTITGGDTIARVAVLPIAASDWGVDLNHVTLTLHVEAPGDFSTYTLSLASPMLDAFFASAAFSFKALCQSDIDCETPAPAASPSAASLPPIDYLAKDFLSFRQALLDFSVLQYPGWQERSEADLGVVLLEAMAAVADDLSYTQDRVAAEATLTTATQRRSVVRHARLIDYEPAPALSAQTLLQFDVAAGTKQIQYGIRAVAQAADGSPVVFETGPSLAGRFTSGLDMVTRPGSVPASALWNTAPDGGNGGIAAYWFDDSMQCLPAGARTRVRIQTESAAADRNDRGTRAAAAVPGGSVAGRGRDRRGVGDRIVRPRDNPPRRGRTRVGTALVRLRHIAAGQKSTDRGDANHVGGCGQVARCA